MKLYIYQGLDKEQVPDDVTHVIVDNNVTVINQYASSWCEYLVSVIMGDNVKRIEKYAFFQCRALRFVQFSKTLEFIGTHAFAACYSLEALFLPSTLKSIEYGAFWCCESLRILILPNDIDFGNVGSIIGYTVIGQIANNEGLTDESVRRFIEWLIHHMDEAPFHKLCYSSSITTKQIIDYLNENGNDSALAIDTIHVMSPLHMLAMNPHAPAVAIAALLNSNMEAIFCLDNQQKTPLDCARDYNVGGLVGMLNGLCNHRNGS